jgi:hypothetical protein
MRQATCGRRSGCAIGSSCRNWGPTGRWSTMPADRADAFDPHFDHLLLIDNRAPGRATMSSAPTGCCPRTGWRRAGGSIPRRIRPDAAAPVGAQAAGTGAVLRSPRPSRRHAMFLLWNGLADYVLERGIEMLFGAASFHGTDLAALAHAAVLSAPPPSGAAKCGCAPAPPCRAEMNLIPPDRAGPPRRDGGDAGADQGLSAAGRLCRRRRLGRSCLQHHRCLPDDGHRRMSGKHRDFYPQASAGHELDERCARAAPCDGPPAGWLRVVLRGGAMAVLTYGGLWCCCWCGWSRRRCSARRVRPLTPWHDPIRLPNLRLPGPAACTVRGTPMRQGRGRGQPRVLAGHLHAERRAAGLFRVEGRGGGLAGDRLAGAGDRHGVHHAARAPRPRPSRGVRIPPARGPPAAVLSRRHLDRRAAGAALQVDAVSGLLHPRAGPGDAYPAGDGGLSCAGRRRTRGSTAGGATWISRRIC